MGLIRPPLRPRVWVPKRAGERSGPPELRCHGHPSPAPSRSRAARPRISPAAPGCRGSLPRVVPGLRAGSPAAPRGAGGRSGGKDSSRPGRRRAGSMARMARSGGTLCRGQSLCLGRSLCSRRSDPGPAPRTFPAAPGGEAGRPPTPGGDRSSGDGTLFNYSTHGLQARKSQRSRQNSAKETDAVVQLRVRTCTC